MSSIIRILIGLSALFFVLGGIEAIFDFWIAGLEPESFSRACSNVALIAIALSLAFKEAPKTS